MGASTQEETAHRTNFFVAVLHSLLNFGTGLLAITFLFQQVDNIHGWEYGSTLAVLGVYLLINAFKDLFIGPSLDALAGMDGEVWQGTFDFTLMRPVNIQYLASFRHWRFFALFDGLLAIGVLVSATLEMSATLRVINFLGFVIAMSISGVIFYSILLAFTGLVFLSPGFLFTWVFNGVFQLARYPVGIYPNYLRLLLTWIVPLGFITTVPAQAISGQVSLLTLASGAIVSFILFFGASILFRAGLKRYASASS
jgi:ABC-2 type transport system permease protein